MRALLALVLLAGCSESSLELEVDEAPAREVLPSTDVWVLRSDQTLREEIQRALARARERNTRVLLEFGADWCPDCNEVVRLGHVSPAKELIDEGYERVFVHVGRFDRHEDLIQRYRIERIATLVVLSSDGRRVAQTTLEPISNRTGLTAEGLAEWLREPRDQWRRPDPAPGTPAPDDSPIFPADVIEADG
ncbi:MAG: thioredoxin family protein [Myxococcota bacterium]